MCGLHMKARPMTSLPVVQLLLGEQRGCEWRRPRFIQSNIWIVVAGADFSGHRLEAELLMDVLV